MCLQVMREPDPEERSGIMYKLVRLTDKPDEFLPYWPGMGTSHGRTNGHPKSHLKMKGVTRLRIIYKLGRTYQVRHYWMVENMAILIRTYRAGVHGWTEGYLPHIHCEKGCAIIKLRYSQAVAKESDGSVIVALRVTPIGVIEKEDR